MSHPNKVKGTRYELKIRRRLKAAGFRLRKTEANARYDIEVYADPKTPYVGDPVRALITEPDRGRTLVTVTLEDFLSLIWDGGMGAYIECKKGNTYKAIHTLWAKEME